MHLEQFMQLIVFINPMFSRLPLFAFKSSKRVVQQAFTRRCYSPMGLPVQITAFSTACNASSKCGGKCAAACHDFHSPCSIRPLWVEHSQCWNCHHFTNCNERFCPECHKIQPVYSVEEGGCNYFQLFGM